MKDLRSILTAVGVLEYVLKFSQRRTLNLKVTADTIQVNAPMRTSATTIEAFIQQHAQWVLKTRQRLINQQAECIYSYCMSHKLLKTIYSILPEYRYLQKI